jgi:hypothetical protein
MQGEFRGFFQEARNPIWRPSRIYGEGNDEINKWGEFDSGRFSELELRMYMLIRSGIASKSELESDYTLDEALKLYALWKMEQDIHRGEMEEMKSRNENRH